MRPLSAQPTALGVEFPEVRDGLLDDFAADADGPDELPVPVDLPTLPARRVTEVYCPAYRPWRPTKSINSVATTRQFRSSGVDGNERYERRDRAIAPFNYRNCGSWASLRAKGGAPRRGCRSPRAGARHSPSAGSRPASTGWGVKSRWAMYSRRSKRRMWFDTAHRLR